MYTPKQMRLVKPEVHMKCLLHTIADRNFQSLIHRDPARVSRMGTLTHRPSHHRTTWAVSVICLPQICKVVRHAGVER